MNLPRRLGKGLLALLIALPLVLPQHLAVTDALYQMQRAREIMAVAVDSTGRHIGIVTIKDLVEEIVGELEAW